MPRGSQRWRLTPTTPLNPRPSPLTPPGWDEGPATAIKAGPVSSPAHPGPSNPSCQGPGWDDALAIAIKAGADSSLRGSLRGEASAAEVIGQIGARQYDMHTAAREGAQRIRECMEWRMRWASVCVPSGGLGGDAMGRTPLHEAAVKGDAEACACLLEAGVDADRKDWRGWTALHVAASRGEGGAVLAILSGGRGRLALSVDAEGRTPLHVWRFGGGGGVEGFRALIAASSATARGRGRTALMECAASGAGGEEVVSVWRGLGMASLTMREDAWPGRSVAGLCAAAGSASAIEALANVAPSALSGRDARGRTPLDDAMQNGVPLAVDTLALMWRGDAEGRREWPPKLSAVLADVLIACGGKGIETTVGGDTLAAAAVRVKDPETLIRALARMMQQPSTLAPTNMPQFSAPQFRVGGSRGLPPLLIHRIRVHPSFTLPSLDNAARPRPP